jgi:hypothetical protein
MREYRIGTVIDIGANLQPERLALLTDQRSARVFKNGDMIYGQGEPAKEIFFLHSEQTARRYMLREQINDSCALRATSALVNQSVRSNS